MRRTALLALISHWRRQPGQLITLVLGLALATGLWSAVQAINGEARANYAKAAAQLSAGQNRVLRAPDGVIALADYVALRRAGWLVTPVLEGRVRLGDGLVTLMGVDMLTYPSPPAPQNTDLTLAPLDVLGGDGRLFARAETLARIGTAPDLPPRIETTDLPPGLVLGDIGLVERLLDRPGQLSRILVLETQPKGLTPLSQLMPDLIIDDPTGDTDTARLTDSFHLNLTAFGLLSFAVGLFIVHGAVGLAFEQRRAMFRTLRALGLPRRDLTLLVLGELVVLALVSGTLGLALGYAVAAALLPDVAATLRGLYGAPVTGELALRPIWFASGIAMALFGTLLAGGKGLWQLATLPLLSGPGVVAWASAYGRRARLMVAGGCALILAGVVAVWLSDGLLAGFALLAGLLLGSAMLLPPALGVILGLAARRARSVTAQWVWADLKTQLPGLSLALMALMLALATNIGVGTMVSSFRLTFTGWLDQRLASELYVTARTDEQGAALSDWLQDRSDAVLPIRFAETELNGDPARIYGIVDHPTYRDNWPLIAAEPDVWDQLAAGTAVLINEQMARRADLWPGDTVRIGATWQAPIAGVYSDYGNPSGQAIVPMDQMLARFDGIANRQFGVRIDPEKQDALVAEMRATFDLPARAVVDQAGIKALSLGIFEKTFVVTGALNILTLGVASFAILTSLLTLWTMRLPHLAPVWALGMTRAKLARLELVRSLALAGLTAVLALPLGLVLAWALLAVINVEAFGWRLPMHLFPMDWLRLGALALLAGGLAAALPARRLGRMPPADLLRVFANER
ncbi:MAG: FtsX-like permease family protein [Sedimentitalea sp.]